MNESQLRDALVDRGRSLYERGYAHGSSGNLSVRLADGVLITPTGSSLGRLDPARIAKIQTDGVTISGDPPSKEAFLHLAMYARRPSAHAIVHLHCTCAVAVSCLIHEDTRNVLAPLTAYHVMRIGTLPLIPYFRPGRPGPRRRRRCGGEAASRSAAREPRSGRFRQVPRRCRGQRRGTRADGAALAPRVGPGDATADRDPGGGSRGCIS